MTVQELLEQRATLHQANVDLSKKAEAEGRDLTPDENVEYDKRYADIESLKKRSDRQTAEEKTQLEMDAVQARKIPLDDVKPKEERSAEENMEIRNRAYNKVLLKATNFTEDEVRALQDTTDTAGGYLHPDEQWMATLLKNVDDMTFIRDLGTKFPLPNADSMGNPTLTDPADPDWTTELDEGDEDSTMAFGKRNLTPHPVAAWIKVSKTLIRKAVIDPGTLVRQRLSYKLGIKLEKAAMTGTGASQPLGLFVASADGINTDRDASTGNTTTAITFDGLIEAKYEMKSQYWGEARWLFHRDAVKMLSKLKDGEGQYQWQPSTQAGQPDMLFSFPVMTSEYVPNTFTTGLYVGMLGAFSNYWWADALNSNIQVLQELYAATNNDAFLIRAEHDGAPVLPEAFTRVTLA